MKYGIYYFCLPSVHSNAELIQIGSKKGWHVLEEEQKGEIKRQIKEERRKSEEREKPKQLKKIEIEL